MLPPLKWHLRTLSALATSLHSNLPPNISPVLWNQTLLSFLKKCCRFDDLKLVHAAMVVRGAHQDSFMVNQFIAAACSTFCQVEYSLRVFAQMDEPNAFVYNALLRGFVVCSSPTRALEFYVRRMCRSSVLPTSFTFSSLIKACALVPAVEMGEALHGRIWKCGFRAQVFVQTGLVDFYASCGRLGQSRHVFDEMGERDAVAWTVMITAHAESGDMISAKKLFEDMPERNTVAWNTMIAGYSRSGDVESAATMFHQMPIKDLVSWTTMISCYSQNKRFRDAIETFGAMKAANVMTDEVTIATVLSACAHLGALDFGQEVHFYAAEKGYNLDVYLGSALIDMYAKCGCIERSLVIFFKLLQKNLFCWNSMIEGLAAHGFAKEALSLFNRMEREEIKPNGVTFISVLSACTHAGLVEEGRRIFHSMINNHIVMPGVEHYGCMVDLLSRAGLLNEAMSLIENMLIEPNSAVWGALLGGCKLHGNIEIGGIAARKLMVLEPEKSGHYSLLVNMCAEANQWADVATIRCKMKQMRVQKSPGNSLIEVGGTIHEFVASNTAHSLFDQIRLLLVGLDGQLKLIGEELELDIRA